MHYPDKSSFLNPASLLTATFGLFLLAWPPHAAGAAVPPAEKLLPNDTLMMMTAPDFAKLREIYRTAPQTQLWSDPAMKPFRDKLVAKLKEQLIEPLERDLGVSFADYADLPQGQLTFATALSGPPNAADTEPGLLLLLDTRDKSAQLKQSLADLRKKWVAAGKSIRTDKIRGVEFSVVTVASNDVPSALRRFLPQNQASVADDPDSKKTPPAEFLIGQSDSLLIVGNSRAVLEKVVVHLTGGTMPALGDSPAFEANRLAVFRDAPVYAWINTRAFFDILNRKPADSDADNANPMAMFSPEKVLAATGFNGLKSIAVAFRIASDGSLFQVFASAPEADRRGLLKLFPNPGKDASPPSFVPADVIKFQRSRVDGQKAWSTLQSVLNEISPQLTSGLNFMIDSANTAAQEKDPAFDLKKNLFGNLGDDLISYQKPPRGTSLTDLNAAPSVWLVGSPQPEQLVQAIKSLLVLVSSQAGSPAEREFLGRKIYSVPLPNLPTSASSPLTAPSRTLSYSTSGGYVALATDAAALEEYLRSGENTPKSLREVAGLTEAEAKAGGTSGGVLGYENQAETSRVLIEALRKSSTGTNDSATTTTVPGIPPFPAQPSWKDWVDFSLLPPFDKISKYFYYTVYAASSTPDGFNFKMYAPVPPGLKK